MRSLLRLVSGCSAGSFFNPIFAGNKKNNMDTSELIIKMELDAWNAQISASNSLMASLSDEDLMKEISPGRNRGIYLLGHLTAIHDLMFPLLRLGEAQYPGLGPIFVQMPDRAVAEIPTAKELREKWKLTNERLSGHFSKLTAGDWFSRHNNITDADFVNEPHRNRLNVLISRTNHLSYHRGQLALLAKKAD